MTEITLTEEITVRLIDKMGGDHSVVAAAKVSTSGDACLEYAKPESAEANAGLINYLMAHRHGTPFEHSSMTFFVHAPIFVWREWHRHRIGHSFNEESGRYKKLDPVFWIPHSDRKILPTENYKAARPTFQKATTGDHCDVCHVLEASYQLAYDTYSELVDRGIAKEVARACLPVGIYSSCWVTTNPRALMSFLSLRTHEPTATFPSYPQAEIEQAARIAERFLAEGWPITYAAFVKNGRVGP